LAEFRSVVELKVQFRDLDALGHVNNAVYASYFETGRLEYLDSLAPEAKVTAAGLILAELTITYKSPAFLREVLLVGTRVTEIRNSSFILEGQIVEKKTQRLVATSRAVLVHYDYTENRAKPVPQEWRELFSSFEGRPL
jgi:acyl-CoA thioester hydrolase